MKLYHAYYHPEGFVVLDGLGFPAYLDGTASVKGAESSCSSSIAATARPKSEPTKKPSGIDITQECPACCGERSLLNQPCPICEGSGLVLVCGKCGKIRFRGEPCLHREPAKDASDVCPRCAGSGRRPLTLDACYRCGGTGKTPVTCPACSGYGEISYGKVCHLCEGFGVLRSGEKKNKEQL